MGHRTFILIGREDHGDVIKNEKSNETRHFPLNLPFAETAHALMHAKGYAEYVKRHGHHFTGELAEHASGLMANANGQTHQWTVNQVRASMDTFGLMIPEKTTLGDVTYAANMAYADFYPDPIKDEASCISYAHKVVNDPDGYEGQVFCRWLADIIGKAVHIEWERFI